ncbi:MAG TPA: hypothetical protein VNI02_03415 [Blastocatellia bacterium]|nr:hypothetical protein [Blastocatellia bacterium]
MKKGFLNAVLGVMLFASFCAGVLGQSNSVSAEEKQKKEKVQIVVVEKKERGKSGSDEFQKPRSEYHKGK